MTKHIEREIRYRLKEGSSIDAWIDTLDLKVVTRITDEYFDDSDGIFYKKGIFIRLRNEKVLEIKFNPAHLTDLQATDHIQYREYSFPISKHMFNPQQLEEFKELESLIGIKRPLPFSFSHFLGCNKLRSLIALDKVRKTYKTPSAPLVTIAVDQFAGLGTFVEFEAVNSNAPYPRAVQNNLNRLKYK